MTLADFGIIAEIVSALAVLVTLVHLARQGNHANRLAQLQTREYMVEMAREELGIIIDDPELMLLLYRPTQLELEEAVKVTIT